MSEYLFVGELAINYSDTTNFTSTFFSRIIAEIKKEEEIAALSAQICCTPLYISSGIAQGALYKDTRKESIFEVKRAKRNGLIILLMALQTTQLFNARAASKKQRGNKQKH